EAAHSAILVPHRIQNANHDDPIHILKQGIVVRPYAPINEQNIDSVIGSTKVAPRTVYFRTRNHLVLLARYAPIGMLTMGWKTTSSPMPCFRHLRRLATSSSTGRDHNRCPNIWSSQIFSAKKLRPSGAPDPVGSRVTSAR